jgi:hypothetical protein
VNPDIVYWIECKILFWKKEKKNGSPKVNIFNNFFFNFRKHCINCRCGKIEHDVIEEVDPGFYFVGRIFDLPLRSKREELQFCYGINSSSDDDDGENTDKEKRRTKTSNKNVNKKNVKFDWIPPNVSTNLVIWFFYIQTLANITT